MSKVESPWCVNFFSYLDSCYHKVVDGFVLQRYAEETSAFSTRKNRSVQCEYKRPFALVMCVYLYLYSVWSY